MKTSTVKKDASDIQAVIANIKGLCETVEQQLGLEQPEVNQAVTPPEEMPVAKPVAKEIRTDGEPGGDKEQEEYEEDKMKKAVCKEAEGNANEDAEKRIDDLEPEEQLTAEQKFMKAANVLGYKVTKMRPDVSVEKNATLDALESIAKSLKGVGEVQKQHGDAIAGLLQGIGFVPDVKKSEEPRKIVQTTDTDRIVKGLIEAIGAAQVQKSETIPQGQEGMKTVLSELTRTIPQANLGM